ncbi:MAG: sulfatase modifying factor 1 [Verrucomicrobiales bacterium]
MRARCLLVVAFLATACHKPDNGAIESIRTMDEDGRAWITIAAGEYTVGKQDHSINPARKVTLASFRIAATETTNAQFRRFVESTGHVTDAEREGQSGFFLEGMVDWRWDTVEGADWRFPQEPDQPGIEGKDDHPVTQISGADARAYCDWLGARLPTIDEWEVAARGGGTTRYPWGDAFDTEQVNVWNGANHFKNTLTDGHLYTAPVKSYPPNAWGLYDVIGNVFEYCESLPMAHQQRPKSETESLIAGRGGSWWCSATTCQFYNVVDIGTMDHHASLHNQGCRVVK